jgi:hypothetical protein
MVALTQPKTEAFKYVREWNDRFLELFPHRGDYLYAAHPKPETRPEWKTESRHLLSDRQIQQGEYLYGVRFGSQTDYLLIDVDPTSLYYPDHDPFAIAGITAALEPVGLVSYVPVRSSYRKGIHLYFPFEEAQPSWAIALVVQTLLGNAGFVIKAGQLEIFPNARAFVEEPLPLYNGHRLPLQAGSYLLNEDWEPIYSTQAAFVAQWKFAQRKNVLDLKVIERVRKQVQRQRMRTGHKAHKFLSDLNIEIEPGWTGSGQTNQLLGKIACRERVFHHVLYGGEPLAGEALAAAIAQVARSLPGYQEFCNHQDELEERARKYARSAEKRYYPLGCKKNLQKELKGINRGELTWNQQQAQAARDRIREAIADMLNQGTLPSGATARFKALKQCGVGSDALYAHKDLWHPNQLEALQDEEFPPVECDLVTLGSLEALQDEEFPPVGTNKFIGLAASDAPPEQSERNPPLEVGGSGGFSTGVELMSLEASSGALLGSVDALSSPGFEVFRSAFEQAKLQKAERMRQKQHKLSQSESPLPDEHYFSPVPLIQQPEVLPLPAPGAADRDFLDVSDLLAEIQVHVKRLGWNAEQNAQFIAAHFLGKRARHHLTDNDLVTLVELLRSQDYG